jgi:RimJ/RimL family protein N-acetyltransferase
MARYYPKLRGEKVYLSPVNVDDLDTYTRWLNNLGTSVPLGGAAQPFGLTREREVLEKFAKEGHQYAIVESSTDTLLGNCGIESVNHLAGTAEVGIFIGDDKKRGKGFGTDALLLLVSYGFKILNLHNIMLRAAAFNGRGLRCYEKVGFREFGRRTGALLIAGKRHDDVYMQVLATEWRCPYLDDELPR